MWTKGRRTLWLLAATLSPVLCTAAQSDDLAAYLPPDQVQWLTPNESVDLADVQSGANANQSQRKRVLLLQQENLLAEERGSLLLIPEIGTHAFQSSVIRHWYLGMPAYGWNTFALQSPMLQVNDFEWDANFGERYSPANDISSLLGEMRTRLALALGHIAAQDNKLVIVAEGVSGALLAHLLSDAEFENVAALVLIGGYFPQYQLNRELAVHTAQLNIPVLDIIPAHRHLWITEHTLQRAQHSKRLAQPSYRQRVLASQRVQEQPRYLLHELNGWLKHEQL